MDKIYDRELVSKKIITIISVSGIDKCSKLRENFENFVKKQENQSAKLVFLEKLMFSSKAEKLMG